MKIANANEFEITVNGETVRINTEYCEMTWVGHDNGGQYVGWMNLISDLELIFNKHTLDEPDDITFIK